MHVSLYANTRSDDLNLGEVFQTMSKKEHTKVWTSVLKAVGPIVDDGRFLSQEEEEEEEEDMVCERCRRISRSSTRKRRAGGRFASKSRSEPYDIARQALMSLL